MPVLHKLVQKVDEKGTLLSSSCDASIILISLPHRDIIRKWYSIFLMNINFKILNKILVCIIQQCIKRIIHYGQMGFILGVWGWQYMKINQCNMPHQKDKGEKKAHDHLNRHRKGIWQNPIPFYSRNTQQTKTRREPPKPDKHKTNLQLTSYFLVDDRRFFSYNQEQDNTFN